jgi:diguanylate cyclase (GGDEF)-like protein
VTQDPAPGQVSPMTVLSDLTGALAQGGELDPTLGRLLTVTTAAVGAPVGVLFLQYPDGSPLSLALTIGLDEPHRAAVDTAMADERDAVAAVARDRVSRTTSDGSFVQASGVATADLRPLVVRQDGLDLPLGVLAVGWDESHEVTDDESTLLDACAAAIAVGVDRGRLASMIAERSEWFERMAHADPLTGLANQRTFARILELELARAGRQGGEVSLAIFDVDDFAAANAEAGHEAGDDILRAVASVLAETVRLVDTVARLGGDEFVVVAPGSAGLTVAERVVQAVGNLQPVGGRQVSVSVGVARFPVDGATPEELRASAEAALQEARDSGRGRIASATAGGG